MLVNLYFLLVSFLITGFYALTAIYYPQIYIFCTYEDLYGEWSQTFFFAGAFVFSALNASHKNFSPQRWFFLALALATFYVFMEEISWGQRLLNFKTPDYFAKHSYQDEANLHNLLTGPVESWTKKLLTYLVSSCLLGYGLLYPLALRVQWKPALFLERYGMVAPPLALSFAFIVAAICELELFSFNEAEIAELLVAFALANTALYYWIQQNPCKQPRQFYFFLSLLLIVFTASISTTLILLNESNQRKEINIRLANGYEKFADRYERYNNYRAVAQTLELYDALEPNNTVILRRIADNYALLDMYAKHDEFIYRAIEIGEKRYAASPDDVAAAISLAKSYYQVNRSEKVYFYGYQAYQIAKKNYDRGKDQAFWAYWLAKAYEQINKQPEALDYYHKAYKLNPDNARYERAYYEKKQLMVNYYED